MIISKLNTEGKMQIYVYPTCFDVMIKNCPFMKLICFIVTIKLLLFIRSANTVEINFLRTKINIRYIY
jgi:hypothetical protein